MDRIYHYYTLREAEEIRHTYSSWIGKKAFIEGSRQETLKRIIVRPAIELNPRAEAEDGYLVEFEFSNRKITGSYEFMTSNGLSPSLARPLARRRRQ